MGIAQHYTPEEDAFIITHNADMSVGEVASALRRGYHSVVGRRMILAEQGRLSFSDRSWHPLWRQEDDDFLKENWGLLSDSAICARLGRTRAACMIRAKRLGICRKMNLYTASDVAAIFGVDRKTPTDWIARGLLKGRRSKVPVGAAWIWNIDPQNIERFIREHPETYDRRRIKHLYWRGLAEEAARANPDKALILGRRHAHAWTAEDVAFLQANYGLLPLAEIGARLGRTAKGCESRAGKTGLLMTAHFITASAAGTILGVSVNRVSAWIDCGLLPAKKSIVAGGAKHCYWQIQLTDINQFREQHPELIAEARETLALGRGKGRGKTIKLPPAAKAPVAAAIRPCEPWDVGPSAWKIPASPAPKSRRDPWLAPKYEGGGRVAVGRY
jgi:hypothetical protein